MNWFKRLALASQLILSFTVVAVVALLVGLQGMAGTSKVDSMLKDMYQNELLSISYVGAASHQGRVDA